MTASAQLPAISGLVKQLAEECVAAEICEKDLQWMMRCAMILRALKRSRGNRVRAARLLGIHRNLLDFWLQEYSLEPVAVQEKLNADLQMEINFAKRRSPSSVHGGSTAFQRQTNRAAV